VLIETVPPPRTSSLSGAPEAMPDAPPVLRQPVPVRVGNSDPPPPEGFREGYAAYLRSADIAGVAALAVPGFVGIAVLTALGGFVGYRQAKSGLAVQAAGTSRFLR
jgi:hypothetical protein